MNIITSTNSKLKVICLISNDRVSSDLAVEHSLSLYIEFLQTKILFDVGQGNQFLENANKLNIDLSKVDYVVISHGHYDHTGGLIPFLECNKKAKIIIRESAFRNKCKVVDGVITYLGIPNLKQLQFFEDRIVRLHNDYFKIQDGLEVVGNFESSSQEDYFQVYDQDGKLGVDTFPDEQVLIIKDKTKHFLFVGCSHIGITNILDQLNAKYEVSSIELLIGGFHVNNKPRNELLKVVDSLEKFQIKEIFTGHCGSKLADINSSRFHLLGSGTNIQIPNKI